MSRQAEFPDAESGPEVAVASDEAGFDISRREVLEAAAFGTVVAGLPVGQADAATCDVGNRFSLVVNGRKRALSLDPRTTLLDALRERLGLTGTKKGCDHGQCGACTVIVEGRRINSCLTLAVMHEGDAITTIEGLARGAALHPMQAAFVHHDGLQCGYCTPGQICSAVAMLDEATRGMPSYVTEDLTAATTALSASEVRERMSGNLCRCCAYPNIVAAISEVAGLPANGEGRLA